MRTLNVDFSVFPVLETERLLFRKLRDSDAGVLHRMRSEPLIIRYLDRDPDKDLKATKAKMREILDAEEKNDAVFWMLELKNNPGVAIGNIAYWRMDKPNFRTEVGYTLLPEYWQKGIMKEALQKTSDYIFNTCGFHSIEANINPDNLASASLLESCGFRREAYHRQNMYHNGKFLDSAIYTLLETD